MGQRLLASDPFLFAGALALYLKTLSPSVYTFDSAELAAGAYALGIVHATGYPLYLLLVKLFMLSVPFGDVAFRANLFSAVCAALGLVVLRRVMLGLTGSAPSALLAALTFGLSYPFWSEAVVAEVYTLHILFVITALWLALRWRATGQMRFFILLALTFGLSFGNHMSAILVAPGLAFFIWRELARQPLPISAWGWGVLAAALGPLTYLYLPIRYAANPALNYASTLGVDLRTPEGVAWLARGQMFADAMFGYRLVEIPGELLRFGILLWETFLGIGLVVAALGVWDQWRNDRPLAIALGLIFAANAIFYINYRVFDKDTMFLPVFVVTSLWLAQGLHRLQERLAPTCGPWVGIVEGGALIVLTLMLVLNYRRVDLSDNWTTRQYAEQIFREAPAHAFIVGGWVDITPLEYLQVVEGRRPDVRLFDYGLYSLGRRATLRAQGLVEEDIRHISEDEIRRRVHHELLAGRPVYSLDLNPILQKPFRLVREAQLYRVRDP